MQFTKQISRGEILYALVILHIHVTYKYVWTVQSVHFIIYYIKGPTTKVWFLKMYLFDDMLKYLFYSV